MRKKRIISWPSFLFGAMTAIICLGIGFAIWWLMPVTAEPDRPDSFAALRKINEMEMIIRSRYLEEPDGEKQISAMLQGMVSGLDDEYAAYYTREEYEAIRLSHRGYKQGIGVTISQEANGDLMIRSVLEDSPAEAAGLLTGDIILKINGNDMKGKTPEEAAELIQGSEESQVTLVIRRSGQAAEPEAEEDTAAESSEDIENEEAVSSELEITVEKGKLEITSVSGGMLADLIGEDELQALAQGAERGETDSQNFLSKIGYIGISRFNGTTPGQFEALYTSLQEQGMTALIIDLRENLGGMVEDCCDTLRQILPEGVIVYESGRNGKEETRSCDGKTPIEIPLVLLVNHNTASASEIFAGAVQDYEIGTIIGTQTYGKGVEQNSYTLTDGSVLKLTTTHYFTPDHNDINQVGITPDIEVEIPEDDLRDLQLAEAVKKLAGEEQG